MLAAVAAIFFRRIVGAQPMSPSLAFRIDALHGPSWQIAHAASLAFKSTAPDWVIGFSGQIIVVSRPKVQHIEVCLPTCGNRSQAANSISGRDIFI
jgi:hypothetical protein